MKPSLRITVALGAFAWAGAAAAHSEVAGATSAILAVPVGVGAIVLLLLAGKVRFLRYRTRSKLQRR